MQLRKEGGVCNVGKALEHSKEHGCAKDVEGLPLAKDHNGQCQKAGTGNADFKVPGLHAGDNVSQAANTAQETGDQHTGIAHAVDVDTNGIRCLGVLAAGAQAQAKAGLVQALGVFVDTIVICSCTAMIMLLAPKDLIDGLSGMDLLQTAMQYHLGKFGVIFIALTLFLFSFSTFLGILFYARCNVAYLFGDKWCFQTAYKVLALVMLFIGGIAAYTFVWDLGDVGIGLMTIFNIIALYPLAGEALSELKSYEESKKS